MRGTYLLPIMNLTVMDCHVVLKLPEAPNKGIIPNVGYQCEKVNDL